MNSNLPTKSTIVVAMSGGVDSSVTAALLVEMGYNVIGLFMKNWDEQNNNGLCTTVEDQQDVVRVAQALKIPHYTINFTKEYRERVFDNFLSELKKGRTPNPDILCNREIKFKELLAAALKLGGEFLATGHYAQNIKNGSQFELHKGNDPGKDQSYFLYTATQSVLSQILFPLGTLHKQEVRQIAKKYNLATAEKKDSTGICFIGERNFRHFLKDYLPYKKGNFETPSGAVVGTHTGVAYYTIGQRRGLGLGGEGDAWFVLDKDVMRNVVIVDRGTSHPGLFADYLITKEPTWITTSPTFPLHCTAKIRYRQADQPCRVTKRSDGTLMVEFDTPQRAITPEQSIVFYSGTLCLGGAIINEVGPSYLKMQKALPSVSV